MSDETPLTWDDVEPKDHTDLVRELPGDFRRDPKYSYMGRYAEDVPNYPNAAVWELLEHIKHLESELKKAESTSPWDRPPPRLEYAGGDPAHEYWDLVVNDEVQAELHFNDVEAWLEPDGGGRSTPFSPVDADSPPPGTVILPCRSQHHRHAPCRACQEATQAIEASMVRCPHTG